MTTDIVKKDEDNIFKLFDEEDEKQIVNALHGINDKRLVYEVRGQVEISYLLLKQLVLEMAQHSHALETFHSEEILLGEGHEEKKWYAKVKVRNQKTKQSEEGVSESGYYTRDKIYGENGRWTGQWTEWYVDSFGRTKAHSKAERNAKRKLIPEYMIIKAIENARKKGDVKVINLHHEDTTSKESNVYCTCTIPKPDAKGSCTFCGKITKQAAEAAKAKLK